MGHEWARFSVVDLPEIPHGSKLGESVFSFNAVVDALTTEGEVPPMEELYQEIFSSPNNKANEPLNRTRGRAKNRRAG